MKYKYEFILFPLTVVFFYSAAVVINMKVDFGYWLCAFLAYTFMQPIVGFLMKKPFNVYPTGYIEYSDENKNGRLSSFVMSILLLSLLIVLMFQFYWLVPV